MRISGTRTIAEYKAERKRHIEEWIDKHFLPGTVTWEMRGASVIMVTDNNGDCAIVQLDDID